jgi:iron complex transport system substrate-binding protein
MRIVSLLPSLTELVCALGRGDELVGVTHECDYPPGVELLPHLTRSKISSGASSGAIDEMVSRQGGSLYDLDEASLVTLRPDLILTQEQCDVCAVNEATVRRSAMKLANQPPVESVNPTDLAGVFAMFRRVGELLDANAKAEAIIDRFEATSLLISDRVRSRPTPRVVLLEWLHPPFNSGHWNPEIIARARGTEMMGQTGVESKRITWDDVALADPDVLLVSACGFAVDRTLLDLALLAERREWQDLRAVREGRVAVTDGSAYFSRPGPRLEDSLRIAAAAIHPELFADLAPGGTSLCKFESKN